MPRSQGGEPRRIALQQGSWKRAASAISPSGTLIGLPEKEPPRGAAQVWEETPKEGGNTEQHARCCTAQFNGALHKYQGQGYLEPCAPKGQASEHHLRIQKGPALGRASKSSTESVLGYTARRG